MLRPLALLLLLALSGCVSYRPAPLEPAAILSELRATSLDTVAVERARVGDGSQSLTPFDPTDGLSEAEVVAVALTLNPTLRAKRLELGEARSLLVTAGLWPNPQVGVGWRPGISGASGYVLEGDVLLELLRPGERGARKDAAAAQIDEVKSSIVAQEWKAVSDVRAQRVSVLAAEHAAVLQREAVTLRERLSTLTREQRELGEGNVLEATAAELELAEARRDLRGIETEVIVARQELNRTMGLPPEYELKLEGADGPLVVKVYDDLSNDSLDERLISGRPELRGKRAEYERAEAELRLAVLRQYPKLSVGPSFERELGGDASLGLGLSLELPLLNRNQGQVAETLARRDRVRAEYRSTLHKLRADAYGSRSRLRRAKLEVETQEREILPLVRRGQELFEGAYRARELNIFGLLTAQERQIRARREYLAALVRYQKELAEFESVTGQPLSVPPAATTRAATTQPN